jgi:hypothetical protein
MAHRQLRAEVTVHESEEREPDRAHPNPHGCPLRLRSAAQRLVVLSACVREPSWLRGGRQPRGHGHPVWHQLARDESGAGPKLAASRTAVISWGVFSHGNVNADFERVTWRRGAPTCRRHAR